MAALNIRISKGLASAKNSFAEIIKRKPKRRNSDKVVVIKGS